MAANYITGTAMYVIRIDRGFMTRLDPNTGNPFISPVPSAGKRFNYEDAARIAGELQQKEYGAYVADTWGRPVDLDMIEKRRLAEAEVDLRRRR